MLLLTLLLLFRCYACLLHKGALYFSGSTCAVCLMQIKQAYRKQCMQHHPDLCPPEKRAQAEIAFKQISEAYAKLTGGKQAGLSSV